jgi:hypothetical protein
MYANEHEYSGSGSFRVVSRPFAAKLLIFGVTMKSLKLFAQLAKIDESRQEV